MEIIGTIELSNNRSITMYKDGRAMLEYSRRGVTVFMLLDPSDMKMIKDWLTS